MKDEIDLYKLKEELRSIIPLSSGGSFELLWGMLYHIRLLKYIRQKQLKLINTRYNLVGSKNKLIALQELDLIKNTQQDIYISTVKSLTLLRQLGYKTNYLPKNIAGEGSINEINNTEVFIQALKLSDFLALLYPVFYEDEKPYLKPDALLVRGTKERYKLEFLEIEASKSNWNDWLENKRINYLRLSKDKQAYSYWKVIADYLSLPMPDIKDFKFSVIVVGKVNKDFGTGFNFRESLNEF